MRTNITLERHESKAIKCGPVELLADGTIRIEGEVFEIRSIPESGTSVGGVSILRSGDDVLGLKTTKKMICVSYAFGGWYTKTLTKN